MIFKGERELKSRFSGLYPMCNKRFSERDYEIKTISESERNAVVAVCDLINGFEDDIRTAAVFDAKPDAFSSLLFTNLYHVPAFVAVMMDKASSAYEKAGFYGEAICLELTRLGLSTCWVSGSIKRGKMDDYIDIGKNERFITCIAFGYGSKHQQTNPKTHNRKALDKMVTYDALDSSWQDVLMCARNAPSAINRQPWHYRLNDEGLFVDAPVIKRGPFPVPLDIGISMLHVSTAAAVNGIDGVWKQAKGYIGVFG